MNRRLKLYKADPHCYWCGELTEYNPMPGGGKPKALEATVDHVYSQRDPRRRENPGKFVNAHNKCNLKRAEIENIASNELWRMLAPYLLGDRLITITEDPELGNSFKKIRSIIESAFQTPNVV
jgi:hypothetical protein